MELELEEYIRTMISQESCALSKCALSTDKENTYGERKAVMKAIFNRLSRFIDDYDKL